jgi:hypothetical protein
MWFSLDLLGLVMLRPPLPFNCVDLTLLFRFRLVLEKYAEQHLPLIRILAEQEVDSVMK